MDFTKAYEPMNVLDEISLDVAKAELAEEDTKTVENDIDNIRSWLSKQEQIKSKLNSDFIIRFLRVAKYDYGRTQRLIESYWTNRTHCREFFDSRQFKSEKLSNLATSGICVPLPYLDDLKRRVVLFRPGKWDTTKYQHEDIAKYLLRCFEVLCEDPLSQIHGLVVFIDADGLSRNHLACISRNVFKKFSKIIQVF
jgi:hypothetical protein